MDMGISKGWGFMLHRLTDNKQIRNPENQQPLFFPEIQKQCFVAGEMLMPVFFVHFFPAYAPQQNPSGKVPLLFVHPSNLRN